jgi:hypothetical protein
MGGSVTADMAEACRDLLAYNHHAQLKDLHDELLLTGRVTKLASGDILGSYSDSAGSSGSGAAARGETFDGCETTNSVNSLENAAVQLAAKEGIPLEEAIRKLKSREKPKNIELAEGQTITDNCMKCPKPRCRTVGVELEGSGGKYPYYTCVDVGEGACGATTKPGGQAKPQKQETHADIQKSGSELRLSSTEELAKMQFGPNAKTRKVLKVGHEVTEIYDSETGQVLGVN